MPNKVRFVNYPLQYHNIKKEIDGAIKRVLENGDFILRQDVKDFEKNLAEFVGTKYAVGLNSCTDALFLTLKALGVGVGDEVITVSHTFIASISVIAQARAKPILIDVKENFLMDETKLEQVINSRTKAIIPVHLNGAVCDMDKIMDIAGRYGLFVIEDAAQALGAKWNDKMAGSWGITGCFSFYPAKTLGCFGDGGAITTDSEEMAEKIRLLRDHGQVRENAKQKVQDVGFGWNSRLDNLQAAILNVKIKHLPKYIERRKAMARIYDSGLCDIKQVKLPVSDTYQNYVIRAERRNELFEFLKENGVECLIRDSVPNHFHKALNLDFFLLVSEQLANEIISLPMYPELEPEQVEYVIEIIKRFYE